jgi:hypothetical protein
MILLQSLNPGKSHYATPYDASQGIPGWIFGIGLVLLLYIGVRVYIEFQKDKKDALK